MKKILLSVLLSLSCLHLKAQSVDYAKFFGGNGNVYALDLHTTSNGNVLILGEFFGTADFDPGPAVVSRTFSTGTDYSAFLSCFDSSGNFLWVKTWDFNIISARSRNVHFGVKSNGNIVINGIFISSVDFDPDAGTNYVTASSENVFLLELNPMGEFLSVKNFGDGGTVRTGFMEFDNIGSIYLSGYYFGGSPDFDPSANLATLPVAASTDAFILKLDSNYLFSWVKAFRGTADEGIAKVTVDAASNLYIVGNFDSPTLNLNPAGGTANIVTSAGLTDGFICKLDSAGNHLWSGNIGGPATDVISSLDIDSLGNAWIAGYFIGTCDLDPGVGVQNFSSASPTYSDAYFTKIDSSGTVQFIKIIGGIGIDRIFQIKFDNADKLYVLGTNSDSLDYDPGAGTFLASNGTFISSYDLNGDLFIVRQCNITPNTIAINNSNTVYVSGYNTTTYNLYMYTSTGLVNTPFTPSSGAYAVLIKMSECSSKLVTNLTINPATITACAGDSATFTATPINGGLQPSYKWFDFNALPNSNTSSTYSTVVYTSANPVISCSLISSEGCAERYLSLPVFVVHNVSPNVTPTQSVYPSGTICLGSSMSGYSSYTFGGTAPTFQWFKNGTLIPGAVDSAFSTTNYSALDVFSCLFVSSAACTSVDSILSSFTVYPATTPALNSYFNGIKILAFSDPGVTFQWYDCANGFTPISGATASSYTPTVNGNYAVVVSNSICTDTSICYSINLTGEIELNATNSFLEVFPNPFENSLELKVSQFSVDAIIQITDITGRVVYKSVLNANNISINTSEWPKGLYFLTPR
jgi:hypothetical protein